MNARYKQLSTGFGAGAYESLGVESGTMAASPHQLIVMLFDGAESAVRKARMHMLAGNVSEKGEAISKAIDIVNQGLLASLDLEKGGDVAVNLSRIYEYISQLLLQANMKNDLAALKQVEYLLSDIGSAWREIENVTKVG